MLKFWLLNSVALCFFWVIVFSIILIVDRQWTLTSHVSLMFLNSGDLRVSFIDSLLVILYGLIFQGAPEIIQDRLINIPPSYVETYKKYTRQGSRVLALAYKSLPDMTVRILWVLQCAFKSFLLHFCVVPVT